MESDHQRAVVDYLKTVPAPGFPGKTLWDFSYAVPNGQMIAGSPQQRARYMAFLKRQGLKPGVSDLCVALPVGRWHGAYLEMKRDESSRISDDQQNWLALMALAGYYTGLAPGFSSAMEHIQAFLKG